MAGRPGSPKSRSVGRYELVVEMAKSQLGSLWVATVATPSGVEPRAVRRIAGGSDKGLDLGPLESIARWAESLDANEALNVLDVVREASELAIVSGYVPSETLRSLLRLASFKRHDVPPRVALRITLDACRALLAAETRALTSLAPEQFYGGLLPDSLLVGTDGVTRLTDIGVAASWRTTSNGMQHAEVAAYAAPEQLDRSPVDSRTDVFILGIMLWEMLSGGKRLFVGSSAPAVLDKVANQPLPKLTPHQPAHTIPEAIESLLEKMLERDPRRRFRSLADLGQALEKLGSEHLALPIEVSDFVTTFANNPLLSRERVLERALNRPATQVRAPSASQPPLAVVDRTLKRPAAPARAPGESQPPPAVPAAAKGDTSLRTPPPPPVRLRQPSAPRISSPELMPLSPPPPVSVRPAVGARPLPLPAQAKLGSRISAPDGMLPPPPVVPRNPKLPLSSLQDGEDDSSSVRAADILRALAVEDSPPPSDELPTHRPLGPEAAPRVQRPAPVTPPNPLPRPPQETLAGHASPTPPPAAEGQARQALVTLPGYGVDGQPNAPQVASEPVAPAPPMATAVPQAIAKSSTNAASDGLFGSAQVAAAESAEEHELPSSAAGAVSADVVAPRPAPEDARSSDEAIGGLPVRSSSLGSRRLPVPMLAAVGGGALALVIAIVVMFGGSSGESTRQPPTQAAPKLAESPKAKLTVAQESATAEPKQSPDEPGEPESEPESATDSEADAAPPAAQAPETETETAAQTPGSWSGAHDRPSSPPASQPVTPPKRKLRAKRTFIPSGI